MVLFEIQWRKTLLLKVLNTRLHVSDKQSKQCYNFFNCKLSFNRCQNGLQVTRAYKLEPLPRQGATKVYILAAKYVKQQSNAAITV